MDVVREAARHTSARSHGEKQAAGASGLADLSARGLRLSALSTAVRHGCAATAQRRALRDVFGGAARLPPESDLPRRRAEHSGSTAQHVAQLEWIEGGYPQPWDGLIDGVQWWREETGEIWFEVKSSEAERFGAWAGKGQKRSFDDWDRLEVSLDKLGKAEARIKGYGGAKREDFKKERDKRGFDKTGGLEALDREVGTNVLVADKETPVGLTGWTHVDHTFEQGGNTKFINMFHLPKLDGDVDAVVMLENYRDSARKFFASDAFFDQWMRAQKVSSLADLPRTFPRWVYRNNISNDVLAEKLNKILDGRAECDVEIGSETWAALTPTDNVKSTLNILAEYNNLNALRGEPPSAIVAMRLYKGPCIRFEVRKG